MGHTSRGSCRERPWTGRWRKSEWRRWKFVRCQAQSCFQNVRIKFHRDWMLFGSRGGRSRCSSLRRSVRCVSRARGWWTRMEKRSVISRGRGEGGEGGVIKDLKGSGRVHVQIATDKNCSRAISGSNCRISRNGNRPVESSVSGNAGWRACRTRKGNRLG